MAGRRAFLSGLCAAGLVPATGWAALGAPRYLSAARRVSGDFVLVGLGADLSECFHVPLPGRGHAAAAHPDRPHAVAFARRPGVYALVLDCGSGKVLHRLTAPEGRHFYGHGAFSRDGRWLYTTENDFDAARGCIGVWDADAGYRRAGEFESGGVGPHEILRLPGSDDLVVANGGIETHPDSGRAKLNLATMQSNLTYLSAQGGILEQARPAGLQRNSIRHLTAGRDGQVGFAMQWQGAASAHPPLLGLHERGQEIRLLSAEPAQQRRMRGYAGSIAFGPDAQVAITGPRGGVMQIFDRGTGRLVRQLDEPDICGVANGPDGLVFTSGSGRLGVVQGRSHAVQLQFDNHLVPLAGAA
ncbi:DUF1513 domain-containing protein [Rhodobacteraceae bacterium F11138]|nr:DUF1513 domain-containing protein [Rhodobacteraceae bacterium F11138]